MLNRRSRGRRDPELERLRAAFERDPTSRAAADGLADWYTDGPDQLEGGAAAWVERTAQCRVLRRHIYGQLASGDPLSTEDLVAALEAHGCAVWAIETAAGTMPTSPETSNAYPLFAEAVRLRRSGALGLRRVSGINRTGYDHLATILTSTGRVEDATVVYEDAWQLYGQHLPTQATPYDIEPGIAVLEALVPLYVHLGDVTKAYAYGKAMVVEYRRLVQIGDSAWRRNHAWDRVLRVTHSLLEANKASGTTGGDTVDALIALLAVDYERWNLTSDPANPPRPEEVEPVYMRAAALHRVVGKTEEAVAIEAELEALRSGW